MSARRRFDQPPWVPLWLPCLCGFLWADTALSLAGRDGVGGRVRPPPAGAPKTLADAPPRDLRSLPGIGERRALDIAHWRWERGGRDLRLSEVPGIGPKTERLLERRGEVAQPLLGE